jgi:hypothetical protein
MFMSHEHCSIMNYTKCKAFILNDVLILIGADSWTEVPFPATALHASPLPKLWTRAESGQFSFADQKN